MNELEPNDQQVDVDGMTHRIGRAMCWVGIYLTEIGRVSGGFVGGDYTPRGPLSDLLPSDRTQRNVGRGTLAVVAAAGVGAVMKINPLDLPIALSEFSFR